MDVRKPKKPKTGTAPSLERTARFCGQRMQARLRLSQTESISPYNNFNVQIHLAVTTVEVSPVSTVHVGYLQ